MARLRIFTLVAVLFGAFGASHADTLQMEGIATGSDGSRPARGMTAAIVESRFGAPEAKVAPVGDPPIPRWEYQNFVVFFEYDRVIHAVVKRTKSS
jgi:hypothetical protein